MNHITKISGLQFDVTRFHIGWTYKIESDYFTCDEAICKSVCPGQLEFLIPSEHNKTGYDIIVLTPNIVGTQRYRFVHRSDIPMKEESL
jgi:hypothetical protein